MVIDNSEFERVADVLADCEQDTCTLRLKTVFSAKRVGRNEVWKLDSSTGDTVAYLKFATDPRWYSRELHGYGVASQMSQDSEGLISANVLFACRARQCFATSPIDGTPVSELFKSAYRFDKNPLRRNAKTMVARNAISGIVEWLHQLHQQSVLAEGDLYDHRPSNVTLRVQRLLRTQPVQHDCRKLDDIVGVNADDIPFLPDEGNSGKIIFGDVTLGNFFWCGNRIGAIDFEDIGIGDADRDFITLRSEILRPMKRFYYFNDPVLQKAIPLPARSYQAVVYELEHLLHDCIQECQTRGRAEVSGSLSVSVLRLLSQLTDRYPRTGG